MKLNITCCLFVLDNEVSSNIRKNDTKKIKVLVGKDNILPKVLYDNKSDIKELIRDYITGIIGSKMFHLEQVYTLGDTRFISDGVDVIYLGVMNASNIKKLDNKYELREFAINENELIKLGDEVYKYKTKEKISNNNIEYIHEIKVDDVSLEKLLLELVIAYKHLRGKIDSSDIVFKFMDKLFTLEDVRMVYEMIKEVSVDKSNFRKRIAKYCEKTEAIVDKKGHRPTQMYKFKPLSGDIWL